jgi:hypothetical protein
VGDIGVRRPVYEQLLKVEDRRDATIHVAGSQHAREPGVQCLGTGHCGWQR